VAEETGHTSKPMMEKKGKGGYTPPLSPTNVSQRKGKDVLKRQKLSGYATWPTLPQRRDGVPLQRTTDRGEGEKQRTKNTKK